MLEQQFQLVYYGRFSYLDVELMPSWERSFFYRQLVDTIKRENQQPQTPTGGPPVTRRR